MNARGLEDTGGPQEWYDSLPIITKNWSTLAVGTTILTNFDIIPIRKLFWSYADLSENFEIWRIFTPFLWLGPFKFDTVITIFMLYQYSKNYEAGVVFNTGGGGGTADYAYMLLLGAMAILATGVLFGLGVFFGGTLVYYVLYVWSKRNPTAPAAIWGIPMKVYGKEYIRTPMFLIQKFGIGEYVPPAPRNGMTGMGGNTFRPGRVNPPRDPAANAPAGGHSWGGGGQRLGRG
eukprot:202320_1